MPDDLSERLAAVRARIRVALDPATDALLDRLVETALERVGSSSVRADEVVDRFRRITDDMTQQARILRLDTMPPSTVVSALERLCPLWPFCGAP